ncbi:hypothetical protein [Kribbella sp. NPDC049227]|uniref:hypothetical protein n=1 Tax=Kribbella sp. NPDC049227 TaxID=3364113 RepID=UPI003713353E
MALTGLRCRRRLRSSIDGHCGIAGNCVDDQAVAGGVGLLEQLVDAFNVIGWGAIITLAVAGQLDRGTAKPLTKVEAWREAHAASRSGAGTRSRTEDLLITGRTSVSHLLSASESGNTVARSERESP